MESAGCGNPPSARPRRREESGEPMTRRTSNQPPLNRRSPDCVLDPVGCLCYGLFPSSHRASLGGSMAEILKLENASLDYALEYAVRLILSGKVVAFPTDTFYGLGADPFNLAAVSEIFRIKGRTAERPIPLLVDRSEKRRVGKECRSRWSPYH